MDFNISIWKNKIKQLQDNLGNSPSNISNILTSAISLCKNPDPAPKSAIPAIIYFALTCEIYSKQLADRSCGRSQDPSCDKSNLIPDQSLDENLIVSAWGSVQVMLLSSIPFVIPIQYRLYKTVFC
ncbi:hypothetical protein BX600DRAFT_470077 [Xylariales sp. PMI_506]|nr:hypothetical protein BX600DRAFT_470077 [Xylariales sp. PMI_506]